MKWDLTVFYKNETEYKKDVEKLKKYIPKVAAYKDILAKDYTKFEAYVVLNEKINLLAERIASYAYKTNDLDLKSQKSKKRVLELDPIFQEFSLASTWVSSWMKKTGKAKIMKLVKKSKKLKEYENSYEHFFRMQKKVLSEKENTLLAKLSLSMGDPSEMYSNLLTSDEVEKTIKLSNGKNQVVNQRNYMELLKNLKKQSDRKLVFEAYYGRYDASKNTIASYYNLVVQQSVSSAKIGKYDSVLDSITYGAKIPKEVITNLFAASKANKKTIRGYINQKAKMLGLEKYHTYDRVQTIATSKAKYDYKKSKALCIESATIADKALGGLFEEVMANGLVDVNRKEGKRGGAYSSSGSNKDIKPMILLNHDDSLNSLFTLMHEAGHSVHSLLATRNNPMATSSYAIYVAEIGSIFAEFILYDNLRNKKMDRDTKVDMLQHLGDSILSTFVRQTLFANFEYEAHLLGEKKEAITYQALDSIMEKLYKDYYGMSLKKDEPLKAHVWAYIPHFYNSPFYVYKYATSFAVSLALYQIYKTDKKEAIAKYKQILKSGGNDYANEIVKKAGFDLSKPDIYNEAFKTLKQITDDLKTA